MTQPENPNVQPDSPQPVPQPMQPDTQNAMPEQTTPQFTGNGPAQQPYGAQPETQINYGAQQNPASAAPFGTQPSYGAPSGGAPAGGVPPYGGGSRGPVGGAQPFPPQGGYDQYPPQEQTDSYSTMTIVGLILAILIPPVGLIISIVAMVNINKHGASKSSRTLALVGTIVGAALTVASIILAVFMLRNDSTVVVRTDSLRSPGVTQSQTPGATGSDDSDAADSTDSDSSISSDGSGGAGSGAGRDPYGSLSESDRNELDNVQQQLNNGEITLEEAFRNPTVKRGIEEALSSQLPSGTKGSISAKGNTLIYTIDVGTSSSAYSEFSTEVIDATGRLMATQMNKNSKQKFSVRYVLLSDGKTIYDNTFTGSN